MARVVDDLELAKAQVPLQLHDMLPFLEVIVTVIESIFEIYHCIHFWSQT